MRWYHVWLSSVCLSCLAASAWGQSESRGIQIINEPEVATAERFLPPLEESSTSPVQPVEPQRTPSTGSGNFAEQFWAYLQGGPVAYNEWQPFAGKPARLYRGESPHGSRIRLIANRKARKTTSSPMHGSILLKENYNSDGSRLIAITVMYRAAGYDPQHNDWFWAKYLPDGTLAKVNGRPGAGRISSCIDCHQTAGGGDYVFSND